MAFMESKTHRRYFSARHIRRTWFRADASGYSAIDMDEHGLTLRSHRNMVASDLPDGIAAECDRIRFSLPNCVEVIVGRAA